MYRKLSIVIFTFVIVFLQFQPTLANGRVLGVNKRYCTGENNKIFNSHVLYDQAGSPYITVTVDPAFVYKMNKERGTPASLPVTPIYDLVVRVAPNINVHCIPQWDANDNLVGPIIPPTTFPYKVALTLDGEEIASSAQLKRVNPRKVGENWEYEWKIKGWPNGIAPNDKLEQLIAKIKEKGASADIQVVVNPDEPDVTKRDQTGASFELCAPVAGSGKYKMIYSRGVFAEGNILYSKLMEVSESSRTKGFEKIDPFKKYKNSFSHQIDLAVYDPAGWFVDLYHEMRTSNSILSGYNSVLGKIYDDVSSCTGGTKIVFVDNMPLGLGDALGVSSTESIKPTVLIYLPIIESMKIPVPAVVMHEIGHAFAGLGDEYSYNFSSSDGDKSGQLIQAIKDLYGPYGTVPAFHNCSPVPESTWWRAYGDKYLGCSFYSPSMGNNATKLYRPSETSIMNKLGATKYLFNVASCKGILDVILGYGPATRIIDPNDGRKDDHFKECMKLDTIKPTGKIGFINNLFKSLNQQTASALSAFDSAFYPAFLMASPASAFDIGTQEKVLVQEGSTPPDNFLESSSGGFIVETFLPDGTIEGDYYGFSDTPTEIGLENPEEQFFLPVEPEVPYFYPASSAPQPPPPPSDTPPSGFAPLVRCFNSVEHPCDFNDLMTLINTVIRFILFVLAVPIAAIMFAYAGFMLVTSGGSTEARGKAKKIFTSAIFGLVIAAGAWLIVRTILSILGYDGAWIGFSLV